MKEYHGCILTPLLLIAGGWVGSSFGTWACFVILAACVVALLFVGLIAALWSKGQVGDDMKTINKNRDEFNKLVKGYNDQRGQMVQEFMSKKRELSANKNLMTSEALDSSGEKLRHEFDQRFRKMESDYESARERVNAESYFGSPGLKKTHKLWKWLVPLGFYLLLFSCSFTLGTSDADNTDDVSALMEQEKGDNLWTPATIVLPHLTDGYRYVSNPDSVISSADEDTLNLCLQRLDDELGIEVAMILVNRVEGDIFDFAQGVFDRYGIGRNDRGLVFVLAVKDRELRTHTGLGLEADLTDQECFMLQEEYIIPSMRAGQPGTGLKYWVKGLEALLRDKQMPEMTLLAGNDSADEWDGASRSMVAALLFLVVMLLWHLFTKKAKRSFTLDNQVPLAVLMDNPFDGLLSGKFGSGKDNFDDLSRGGYNRRRSSAGSVLGSVLSGHSSSGSSWGGGRSSGYGGGRSGGGGATSRW